MNRSMNVLSRGKQNWLKLAVVGLMVLFPLATTRAAAPEPQPPAQDRAAWMDEARFGMFIHWGIYSQLGRGEWVMNREKIPVAEYEKLAATFNPVKFNAEEWVRIAKDAGMRYIVITSKHHDGFAMFGSKVSPYNIVDATPFKRDPLKELAAACQKYGIRLGFYYSHAQDWHHPGGAISRGPWDPRQKGDFDTYFQKKALPQIRELLTGYGPVAVLWCDTPWQMTPEKARQITRLVRELQPATLINSRILYHGRDIPSLSPEQLSELRDIGVDFLSYGDRQIPANPFPDWHWETCMTLNRSWGYRADDHDWKTPATVIRMLVEVTSKGGSFLLNVGPTAEGVIQPEAVAILRQVGDWLKVNGESIYGAGRANLKSPAPAARAPRGRRGEGAAETGPDWLATARPGKLYIHLFRWPQEPFALKGVSGSVEKVSLLADPAHEPLRFQQDDDTVTVHLPPKALDDRDTVLCLELR
ncbi:MAG: alpha-L-fucosidase [Thermogutta sp.]|uniref:alpha-L-fucosidase n=1 Tax=Thermogutta sp. TaxID=1962930 RepID=UPI0019ABE9DE|nr:alpha-L-fucosidase [Thermogutta sp.]MBC7350741.1 alpha-L-fucosidase [Thermogutta sp.]